MFGPIRKLSAALLPVLYAAIACGQDVCRNPGFGIEANLMAGRIIKHSIKFTAPVPALSGGIDVNYTWQTYGKKEWEQRCNFPKIGVGMTYTDYGNNRVFGHCIGIYPSVQIPLLRYKAVEWTMRIGNGLCYVTRKYQSGGPTDTVNTAIGSHINDFAIFMTDIRWHLNRHWHVQAGANFTHISNGDYQSPNLGVNMVGAHLGAQYFPGTCSPAKNIRQLSALRPYWVVNVRSGISYKQARAEGAPILPTYIASASAGRRWSGRYKAYLGADYAFHNDVLAFLRHYGIHERREKAHSWDGAVFGGGEYMLGNLGITLQVGVYYRQTFLKFVPVYEKFGGNYYLFKRSHGRLKEVFISAMLTTHGIVAEYSEFGVGIGL